MNGWLKSASSSLNNLGNAPNKIHLQASNPPSKDQLQAIAPVISEDAADTDAED